MTDDHELDTFYYDVLNQTGMDVRVYSPWSVVRLSPMTTMNMFVVEARTTHRDYGLWCGQQVVRMHAATDALAHVGLMIGRRLREMYETQVAIKRAEVVTGIDFSGTADRTIDGVLPVDADTIDLTDLLR